jgi:hypothetical protein
MQKKIFSIAAFMVLVCAAVPCAFGQAQTDTNPYPSMLPVDQYLIADQDTEVALARTAAPASVSTDAEVMVLDRTGFRTAVEGTPRSRRRNCRRSSPAPCAT